MRPFWFLDFNNDFAAAAGAITRLQLALKGAPVNPALSDTGTKSGIERVGNK